MVALESLAGVGLGVAAAFTLAVNSLCVRMGTDRGRVFDVLLVVFLVNVAVGIPLFLLFEYPDVSLTVPTAVAFMAAGVVGQLVARTTKYLGIQRIGASRTQPITALNVLVASVLAVVLLGETATVAHLLGIVLAVLGVSAISWETARDNPLELSRRDLATGLVLPGVAALLYGSEPVFARFGLVGGTSFLTGFLIASVTALAALSSYRLARRDFPTKAILQWPSMKWYLAAGVTNSLFTLLYFAGLSIAPVTIVYAMIPLNVLFVIGLSFAFVPAWLERVTWQLAVAASVVVAGVVMVIVFS